MPTTLHPQTLEPQLCTLSREVPTSDSWLHEIKYDGWRMLARKDGKNVRLFSRGGVEWSGRLPKLTLEIRALRTRAAWFDGELVYLDKNGYPCFDSLFAEVSRGDERHIFYQVWDIPCHNNRSLTAAPPLRRKAILQKVLRDCPPKLRYVDNVTGNGRGFFASVDTMNLEGIVSKRINSCYSPGRRTRDWLKIKAWRTYSVVIGGLLHDSDGRLEALLVGTPNGTSLAYAGRVEFGLNRLGDMWDRFERLSVSENPFEQSIPPGRKTWVRPEMEIVIQALPRKEGSLLRHATLLSSPSP